MVGIVFLSIMMEPVFTIDFHKGCIAQMFQQLCMSDGQVLYFCLKDVSMERMDLFC